MSDQDLRVGQRMIASGTGGAVSVLCMTPLEVIKTRLQAQQKGGYTDKRLKGTIDALVKIPKREGLTALWSGLSPTLAMVIPSTVLYFTSYDVIKIHLQTQQNFSPSYAVVTSGAIARTVTVFAIAPLELIRTKMQSEKITFTELRKVLIGLTRSQGVGPLYMGLGSTLYRDVLFSCIYWSSYEFLKRTFCTDQRPSLQFTMIAGAAAGSTAAVITLPFDVIKTHRQMAFGNEDIQHTKSTTKMIRELYRMSGFRALFAGIIPRLARVAPSCAIMLSTYEGFKTFFLKTSEYRKHS